MRPGFAPHVTRRAGLACTAIIMAATAFSVEADDSTKTAVAVDYLKEIKPLLTTKCVACHGGLRQKGNLRLDTAKFALKGGDSGPAIVKGDSKSSVLIEAVLGANGRTKMPIDGEELKPEQIDVLRRWIDAGAKAPDDEPVADPRDHWAFQKPVRPPVPLLPGEGGRRPGEGRKALDSRTRDASANTTTPQNKPSLPTASNDARVPHPSPLPEGEGTGRSLNPIDAFINAEHELRGLTPLPSADKATLLRRVFLDLIGLPPTSEELRDFLNDDEPDAYERAVDRLLDSPEHARRWARHWMDVWRYSDWYGSRGGNELRNSRRHIWRWRDWIIESVAADKGYDRMIVEMLAADEIAPGNRDIGRAAGYLGRSYYVFNRHVWLHDTVEYTAAAFLGLTLKCCRCHDHKYDPLAQEEYYRLKAFFEPHNVRTDQLIGKTDLITGNWPAGAPPGNKLKDGDDVIFDADLAAPTYLLERGNEKNPVTDNPLSPGVPSVLNLSLPSIEPITLPLEAYYPDLRPERRKELIDNAQSAVVQSEAEAANKQAAVEQAKRKMGTLARPEAKKTPDGQEGPSSFLDDNFAEHRKDVWQILSGDWAFQDKRLRLKSPGHFLTIATLVNHPQDFKATLKYRTLPGGSLGSVGLFFDMVELKDAQAVYTHVNASSSGVQAFHRQNGAESYPAAGIVSVPLKLNEEITLEITARGPELKIWLNGELKLTYTMPTPRHPGRFALWCHEGLAEFVSLKIVPFEMSVEELRLAVRTAESEAALAAKAIEVARAEAASLEARIAAEVAKHVERTGESVQSTKASRAERAAALAKAELEAWRAEQQLDITKAGAKPDDAKAQEAVKSAESKLVTARAAVEAAKNNAAKEDATYTPLGPTYPPTSTGRRLALANWLTHKDNPLTARVAVNHVWKRHFGAALVPSVANFGLNGKPPTHPALLDWLAVEFMESGWNLRHLHRLMVTSAAYRRKSSHSSPLLLGEGGRRPGEGSATADSRSRERPSNVDRVPHPSPLPEGQGTAALSLNAKLDPDNRFYWRANVRRMEAEVVRDTLWSLTTGLDRSFSGPELEPSIADTVPRRSLYFRHTPDDQAAMLELFDGPSAAECFERSESIMPQQALSLANSPVALTQSRLLARELALDARFSADADFVRAAFRAVLTREPSPDELAASEKFLQRQSATLADPSKLTRTPTGLATSVSPSTEPRLRARENLVHVLLSHQDFVTIR